MSATTRPRLRARARVLVAVGAVLGILGASFLLSAPANAIPPGIASGVISNWDDATMAGTVVYLVQEDGGSWTPSATTDVPDSTGHFSIAGIDATDDYTLYFDLPDGIPYLDSFLGGELFDPTLAQTFPAVAGIDSAGIVASIPEAQAVSGVVMSGATPLSNAYVVVFDTSSSDYFDTFTLPDGTYSVYVPLGRTYGALAYLSSYEPQYFYLQPPCGCTFTDIVVGTLTDPPNDAVDFDLIPFTFPFVVDLTVSEDLGGGTYSPLPGITAYLYAQLSGVWVPIDHFDTDALGIVDLFSGVDAGYRIAFSDGSHWLDIQRYADLRAGGPYGPAAGGGCYIDAGTLTSADYLANGTYEYDVTVDPVPGTCGPPTSNPAPPGPAGGASAPSASTGRGVTTVVSIATPRPTATPTPKPTAKPTLRPTASPSETPVPQLPEVEPSGPPWWLWLIIVLAVLAIIGVIVAMAQARRR